MSRRIEALHPEPVWRDLADFVIGARLVEDGRSEQLWARRVGDRRFEVCCVPFFLYDIALGDIVVTDERYDVVRVVERSGRFVFRVWFGETGLPIGPVVEGLLQRGALLEWSSEHLLAVDAADEEIAQRLSGFLIQQEASGGPQFETGRRGAQRRSDIGPPRVQTANTLPPS